MELLGRYSKLCDQGKQLRRTVELATSVEKVQVKEPTPLPKIHKLEQRLSPTVGIDMAAAYRAGASTPELRRRFGLSQSSVLKLLAEHGVEMRFQGLSDEDVPEAVRRYEAGQTLVQLGEWFKVSPNAVRRVLMREGVKMRPKGKRNSHI